MRTVPPNREEEENQHHLKGDREKAHPPQGGEKIEHHQKGEVNFSLSSSFQSVVPSLPLLVGLVPRTLF